MEKILKEIRTKLYRIELGLMVADRKTVISDIRKIRFLCRELTRGVNKYFNTATHMVGVGKVEREDKDEA